MFAVLAANISAQEITGSWSGQLNIQGTKLGIVFHIEKTDTVYVTKMDSPNQGALGLPTTSTTFVDNNIEIKASSLGITYQGTVDTDSIVGLFKQSGMEFPLILKRSGIDVLKLNRPQEPKPPFSYISKDIVFVNKEAKIELAGTFTFPDSIGTFPAVILIAGSGPNDRDETVFGHKPFLVIADYLTRHGFAVLRYDKRGVAKSKGFSANTTTQDYASDASAAVAFLKTQKNIDKKNIALIGHSEGGIIAPIVASKDKTIKTIVLMAGSGISGREIILDQNKTSMLQGGLDSETIDAVLPRLNAIFDELNNWKEDENNRTILRDNITFVWNKMPIMWQLKNKKDQYVNSSFRAMASPWFRQFIALNPATYLEKVKCPVLAVNGEKDMQVRFEENLSAIENALIKGGNQQYEIKAYPNLNHLFQECETGNVDEYVKIEQTISPEVLSDIELWLKKSFGIETDNQTENSNSKESES